MLSYSTMSSVIRNYKEQASSQKRHHENILQYIIKQVRR